MKIVRAVLVIAVVVAAAIAANVALLGTANGGREPAGTLSPRTALRPAPVVSEHRASGTPARHHVEPGERSDD